MLEVLRPELRGEMQRTPGTTRFSPPAGLRRFSPAPPAMS